jgi:type VI secretion system protein VasD
MNHARRLLACVCLLILALCTAGCPKEPTRVTMVLAAGADLNPDQSGQALSVVVRVYQLKDKGRLENADYNAILKSERETLSDDLLERQERVVQPGTQEMMEITAHAQARYIGFVALFRNPAGDTWRRIVPVAQSKTQKINLTLREQTLEVTSGK